MKRFGLGVTVAALCCCLNLAARGEMVRLDKSRFLDKCKGAWAGQMLGVCFGSPTEFNSNGAINESTLRTWKPAYIEEGLQQDDCYVEMTFLKALERRGLDITPKQAGRAFGGSKYELWHANLFGRENVRKGIMPPLSGNPEYNPHADDIDFQIESDLFGIICPGLPRESNRLCDVFGHIMNYGDGVYGGMFMAGMYAAAYFEDANVRAVVEAGLACIPPESLYRQCIADALRWHDENPNDWKATWNKVEEKWQDDVDCEPGNAFNIDAKLNGAYVVMGLVYGNGDIARTLEVATRCGQDSDCNPSNAAGVLGCMKGFSGLAPEWVSGIEPIKNKKFIYTDYSFETLQTACRWMAEQVIQRSGGTVEKSAYMIPRQAPEPPCCLEQWTRQKNTSTSAVSK